MNIRNFRTMTCVVLFFLAGSLPCHAITYFAVSGLDSSNYQSVIIPVDPVKTGSMNSHGQLNSFDVNVSIPNPHVVDMMCKRDGIEGFAGNGNHWIVADRDHHNQFIFFVINFPGANKSESGKIATLDGKTINWRGHYFRLTGVSVGGIPMDKLLSESPDYAPTYTGQSVWGKYSASNISDNARCHVGRSGLESKDFREFRSRQSERAYPLRNIKLTFESVGAPPAGTFSMAFDMSVFWVDVVEAFTYKPAPDIRTVARWIWSGSRETGGVSVKDYMLNGGRYSHVNIQAIVPAVCNVRAEGDSLTTIDFDYGEQPVGGIGGLTREHTFYVNCNTQITTRGVRPVFKSTNNTPEVAGSYTDKQGNGDESKIELELCGKKQQLPASVVTARLNVRKEGESPFSQSITIPREPFTPVPAYRHRYKVTSVLYEDKSKSNEIAANCTGKNLEANALIYIDMP